jgi:NADH:ubiquinone oxidoreductase subunit E
MSFLPGLGIAKGMALTLLRFFQPKVTIMYPEVPAEGSPKFRGRLQLLYDEWGTLKCETCFQCAQACPIECIDMGGVDTRDRFHVHWGPAEQFGERREESAVRRSGRPVPDETSEAFEAVDTAPLDAILTDEGYDPRRMLTILARTQQLYGHLPVAALKHISHATGAWYAEVYGTATFYDQLRMAPGGAHELAVCRCAACTFHGGGRLLAAAEAAAGTTLGGISPEGAVRLATAACRSASPEAAFVTLDGTAQAAPSAKSIGALVTRLRAAHAPVGRA